MNNIEMLRAMERLLEQKEIDPDAALRLQISSHIELSKNVTKIDGCVETLNATIDGVATGVEDIKESLEERNDALNLDDIKNYRKKMDSIHPFIWSFVALLSKWPKLTMFIFIVGTVFLSVLFTSDIGNAILVWLGLPPELLTVTGSITPTP